MCSINLMIVTELRINLPPFSSWTVLCCDDESAFWSGDRSGPEMPAPEPWHLPKTTWAQPGWALLLPWCSPVSSWPSPHLLWFSFFFFFSAILSAWRKGFAPSPRDCFQSLSPSTCTTVSVPGTGFPTLDFLDASSGNEKKEKECLFQHRLQEV